jgi:transglutaminase-like putative cysteine protease
MLLVLTLVFIMVFAGCTQLLGDNTLRYLSRPTRILYDIQYGYTINVSGYGPYNITYFSDPPRVVSGSIVALSLFNPEKSVERISGNNQRYLWSYAGNSPTTYAPGISASVTSQTYFTPDLNGETAATIEQLTTNFPSLVHQYTQAQMVDNVVYIDPLNPNIMATSTQIHSQLQTNNSLLLAKGLFAWLKENTQYVLHSNNTLENTVQSAAQTYQLRTGDCDDLSYLYISMCRSQGIPARFIRGYLIEDTGTFPTIGTHAWTEVFVGEGVGNNGWIPVECAGSGDVIIEEHQNFGIEDASHLRLYVDDGSNQSLNASMTSISWSFVSPVHISVESFLRMENFVVLESKHLVVTAENQRYYE